MRRTFEALGVSCDDTVDLDGVGVPEDPCGTSERFVTTRGAQ